MPTDASHSVQPPRPAQRQALKPRKPDESANPDHPPEMPVASADEPSEAPPEARIKSVPAKAKDAPPGPVATETAESPPMAVQSKEAAELDATIAEEAVTMENGQAVLDGVLESGLPVVDPTAPAAQARSGPPPDPDSMEYIPAASAGTEADGSEALRVKPESVPGESPVVSAPEVPRVSESAPPTTEAEPAPAAFESPSAPPQPAEKLPTGPSLLMRLLTLISRMLSLPMRLVPPRFRHIVDLLALSLVFWVPIVWTLALLLAR